MEELKVTNDYVFKKIFGKKGNENILKDLLISILEIPIDKIEILNDVHLDRNIEENKLGILDIKATLNNNITVNIEMQVKNEYNMVDRSLYYWANLYSNSLYKKQNYIDNNRTIVINILGFNIFKDGPYHEKAMIRREYNGEILTEDLEMHFIQIPKCKEEKIGSKLDLWIRFIGNIKEGEMKMGYKVDKETEKALQEAEEILHDLNANKETRIIAELRAKAIRDEVSGLSNATQKGIEEGMKEGKKQGLQEGRKNEKIEIARKMKQKGIDIEEIIEITGLTKEEIEKL